MSEYSAVDIEYFVAEHDHAIATARSEVHAWDSKNPEVLLEALQFLHEYVAARGVR